MANAQKLETETDLYTGYLTTTNFDRANTIMSIDGVLYMIYDNIPIALVRYPAMNPREEFEVPSTIRRICNNAFQGTKYLKTLKIHNTVTEGRYVSLSIGEKAFDDSSIENFVVIENDATVGINSQVNSPEQRKELARYNLKGQKVSEKENGIQLIAFDNKSTKKILKKNK